MKIFNFSEFKQIHAKKIILERPLFAPMNRSAYFLRSPHGKLDKPVRKPYIINIIVTQLCFTVADDIKR